MSKSEIPEWAADAAATILQLVLKKDSFTFHHCCRVGQAARQFGKALGLPEFELAILEYSGLFHDIGKVGLPDSLLLKPDRLNDAENTLMRTHAEMSVEIIRPLMRHAFFRFMAPGIRYHHERFDGRGYPSELKGEKIPLAARAIAVVDSVDAMMHTRPYRTAMPWDYVQKELIDYSGTQFDPYLVQVYLEGVQKGFFSAEEKHTDAVVVPYILRAA